MNENDFFSQELLTLELKDKLLAFDCIISYEVAQRQVDEFITKEAEDAGVTREFYLATHSPSELVASWVEKIVSVSEYLDEEINGDYPLLAVTSMDAGILVDLVATTLSSVRPLDEDGFMTDSGLRVIAALGRQIALPSLPDHMCLLTQMDTFALASLIRDLRALPVDVRDAPHMEWVESCNEMIEGCFEEIADRVSEGDDLSSPEKRVFVISLTEDDGPAGIAPPSTN